PRAAPRGGASLTTAHLAAERVITVGEYTFTPYEAAAGPYVRITRANERSGAYEVGCQEAAPPAPRVRLATLVDDQRARAFPPQSCRNSGDTALELVTALVQVL